MSAHFKLHQINNTEDHIGVLGAVTGNLVEFNADGLFADSGASISDFSLTGHTHTAANITDFDTEVGNHTDVSANTSARHTQDSDLYLDFGNANQVSASEIRTFIDSKAQVNGLATLDATGKIPTSQVPSIAITDVYVVADITARDALTVETGDVAKVTDAGSGQPETYIYDGSIWIILEDSSDVLSVNSQTGVVVLDTDDVSEGSANLYYTEGRVSANVDVAANTSARHVQNTDVALRTDKLTVDVSGNTTIAGDLKIKVYAQANEPTLSSDEMIAIWKDTDASDQIFLIFRRGTGDQVSVEMA